jgi:site-specific DNA-methyltransferase (adenine-specific)
MRQPPSRSSRKDLDPFWQMFACCIHFDPIMCRHHTGQSDPETEGAGVLFYGDNLEVLRQHIKPESIDLIYLDPPFNSDATYNVFFDAPDGGSSEASIQAFDDSWTWGEAAQHALFDVESGAHRPLASLMNTLRTTIGESSLLAYLAMMTVRLIELHTVLKSGGSLYLHCDSTASHYLKLILDAVFEKEGFTNEIIWQRANAKSHAFTRYPSAHDTILLYRKGKPPTWNPEYVPHSAQLLKSHYSNIEEATGRRYTLGDTLNPNKNRPNLTYEWNGHVRTWRWTRERMQQMHDEGRLHYTSSGMPRQKRYLDEMPGTPVTSVWTDIPPLNSQAQERLGYPTQKPRRLLERIIATSSNPGDIVLDPFCGCGTAVDAAQKLGRRWIGIDVTHIAIGMIEDRMRSAYPGVEFETIGVPKDVASAERLAADNPLQFQQWACWQVGGYPNAKQGADKGVDGWFNYLAEGVKRTATGVISVNAGDTLSPNMVRDLGRVMERDNHRFGLLLLKKPPTKGMREEAASHPIVGTEFGRFPALQLITLADIFHGIRPKLPPLISPVKKALRVETRPSHQSGAQANLL